MARCGSNVESGRRPTTRPATHADALLPAETSQDNAQHQALVPAWRRRVHSAFPSHPRERNRLVLRAAQNPIHTPNHKSVASVVMAWAYPTWTSSTFRGSQVIDANIRSRVRRVLQRHRLFRKHPGPLPRASTGWATAIPWSVRRPTRRDRSAHERGRWCGEFLNRTRPAERGARRGSCVARQRSPTERRVTSGCRSRGGAPNPDPPTRADVGTYPWTAAGSGGIVPLVPAQTVRRHTRA